MTFYPDLGTETQVAAGQHIRAIGWLGGTREYGRRIPPYTQGVVPADFLERLKQFAQHSAESTKALHWPSFFGSHTCELCRCGYTRRPEGYFNFGVPAGNVLYVAPELIVHYVEDHRYAPPAAFIAAVLNAPLPDTASYRAAIARFVP